MTRLVTWTNQSTDYLGTEIFRGASLDPESLPEPVATVGPVAQGVRAEWPDRDGEGDLCYLVRDFDDQGVGEVSEGHCFEEASISPPDPSDVVVVLAVADTTHASATTTKSMLLDAGFLDAKVTIHDQDNPIPACDIILVPRGSNTAGDAAEVLQAYQNGTPVVAGLADGISGEADAGFSYHARWSNTVRAQHSTDDIEVVDTNHYITQELSTGTVIVNSSNDSWQLVIVDGEDNHIGSELATGDSNHSSTVQGRTILLPIDSGILDLDGGATPARGVFCGFLYGGQSDYTAAARDLITRSIQWCLMN